MAAAANAVTTPPRADAQDPREDGRTRCTWVAGRPELYAFHDAEYGMVPDDETMVCERLLLTWFQRERGLADVLDARHELWDAFCGADLAKVAALDDDALAAVGRRGGIFADRDRVRGVRDLAAAAAATASAAKGLREYALAVRFLAPEEQIADMLARFPGFDRLDAAHLMENLGLVAGCSHERDCWRA